MNENVKNIFKRIVEFFKKTDKKKLIIIGSAIVVTIIAAVVITYLLNRTNYTVLFSNLSAQEAGSILSKLEGMGVPAKADGTDTIMVPEEQADDLRMQLAGEGYPQTGLNYDLFSGSSTLGTTDLQQQTYLQYQLQENMRTTINRMSKVKDSLVIVNLASASSYVVTDNSSEARVAVLLNLESGQELTTKEARTVGQFVLKCVPKLKIENISIVDNNMNYYDIMDDNGLNSDITYSDTMQQLTEQLKQTMKEQVLAVLEPSIGKGNVAVSVNLDLNFDKKTVNSVEYAPPIEGEDQGMLSSSEESNETSNSGSKTNGGQTGTAQTNVTQYSTDTEQSDTSSNQTKTYNYELNKIETQIEKAQGEIQELSVAVLVNSNIEGVADYVDTVKNLVSNAVGVSKDLISVELMPFTQSKGITNIGTGSFDDYFSMSQKTADTVSKNNLMKTGIVSGSLVIIVIFLLNFIAKKKKYLQPNYASYGGLPYGGISTAPDINQNEDESEGVSTTVSNALEEKNVDYLQDMRNIRSEEIEKVEQLISEAPEAVIQTLRAWLNDEN